MGCCAPSIIWGGEMSSHLTQCRLGRGLSQYQVPYSAIQPYGHNGHGPKIGRLLCPLFEGGSGSPSNTMWPGPRPTTIPSGALIHPTVWPQYTNVTDRTDRQHRANRFGATVCKTVRPMLSDRCPACPVCNVGVLR